MNYARQLRSPFLGLLVVVFTRLLLSPAVHAGDKATMKCAANQERVWVYDSLTSFNVSAKLSCGETVEIVGRVKGFVKIHSASGVEGYVPDSQFPGLPPLEDDSNQSVGLAQRLPKRSGQHSSVAVPSPEAANPAPVIQPVENVVAANQPAASPKGHAAVAVPPAVTVQPAPEASVKAASVSAPAAPPAAASAPVDIVLTTATEPPTRGPAAAPAKSGTASANKAASANPPSVQPASVKAGPHSSTSATSPVSLASKSASANSSNSKSASSKSSSSQPPAAGSTHSNPAPAPSPAPSAPASNLKPIETTANFQPSRTAASLHPVAATVESEDFPDSEPVSESADPSCQIFFSAYGLTPDQFKWMAQNRKHRFANVCPAPDVSRVDFVVIFTHDVDFYGGSLPQPVHTDKNGFSDFSPMTMMDTAAMSLAEAEKARREYVYVFQMKRGAFDPSKFSPRRRYQFTKAESNSLTSSHASARTIEDAFHFMEEQGPGR